MKLLSKNEAHSAKKIENDDLIGMNVRLREYMQKATLRLNTLKDSYAPDKMAKLKEFEEFCADLQVKRSKLLKELSIIEEQIEKKRELYYGLVEKQDALEEKVYQLHEQEKKLELREQFVTQLEEKIKQVNARMV